MGPREGTIIKIKW